MKVSLILTTYNWPQALSVTLNSVLQQTYPDFEIIIADDGSSDKTVAAVRQALEATTLPWCLVRHRDDGIRQARVKNMGVRFASGDYFIFIDHDVALHPEFISDHVRCAETRTFLQGKRVFLSPPLTQRYLQTGCFSPPHPWALGLENRKNGLRLLGLAHWVNRKKRFQVTLRGCNLSMHRETFMTIDGYDELFDGLWGREDSDICYRMFNQGIQIKNLWLAGIQYHLHHPSIKRKGRDRLDDELDRCLKNKRMAAIQGYSKMSSEGVVVAEG